MLTFAFVAALLIAAVIVLLLPPLLRGRASSAAADQRQANLAIFRDQQAELERERQDGTLAEADYAQAKEELQRRLLEEVQASGEAQASGAAPAKKSAFALAVLLPVGALVGYTLLGTPRALDPAQTQPQRQVTPEQIVGMVDKLAARLKDNPDDKQGWIMLGRSYKMMSRFAEAADAYGKAGDAVTDNSALLADYAETVALANGGKFAGKPTELLNRALKLEPNEPQALILSGVAAGDRGDFKAAVAYWERLLPLVEPGSEEEQSIKAGIAKLQEKAAATPAAPRAK
ncbi:MAG TPA: c-type cytochrome biogenesis protein CcmI [Azospira sp.]|nr:c-type cytochrome biogenesis protein CcmI [Azospira sp.]